MKQKNIVIILFSLFILTILWVVFNIYHNLITSSIKDPLSIQIIPIEEDFDTNTIDKIKNRKRVNPLYDVQSGLSETPTEIPVPTEEPTSTQSAEISPTLIPEEEE